MTRRGNMAVLRDTHMPTAIPGPRLAALCHYLFPRRDAWLPAGLL